jgi:hypothetical protein
MLRGLDKLAGYENYRRDVAPHIKKALSEGWDVDRLLSSFKELAAAKLIEKALNGEGKDQLAALKEVLDRTQGKPTEKVEIRTKYDKMSDKELDALLTSKMKEIKAP